LVDDEQGLERGVDGEEFYKGIIISLEGEVCITGLSVSIGATVSAC